MRTRRWTVAHTRLRLKKCLECHRHPLKKGCIRRHAINLVSPERIRISVDGPLRLKECWSQLPDANAGPPQHLRQAASSDCHRNQDRPDLIHVPRNTAGLSVSRPSGKTVTVPLFKQVISLQLYNSRAASTPNQARRRSFPYYFMRKKNYILFLFPFLNLLYSGSYHVTSGIAEV